MAKKKYIKPELSVILLDNTISLVMMTVPGHPTMPRPMPHGSLPSGQPDSPFASPFEEKPFN